MKIVFNSRRNQSPATIFYRSGFQYSSQFSFNDYHNLDTYDIALFMAFKEDLVDLKTAKQTNKEILTGVIDARDDQITDFLPWIDFFIVDSIEMMDSLSKYQKPMFRYFEYFDIPTKLKKHIDKDSLVIGYHGNKIHLMNMYPLITDAMDQLAKSCQIKFAAMYNYKSLEKWDIGLPKNIAIEHIQFDEENYHEILDSFDIGIVPANVPYHREQSVRKSSLAHRKVLNHEAQDLCMRFKMLTNPGRLITFAKRGIPVVSDMFPSACEMIKHGETGYLAHNTGGWYVSLKTLANSAEHRQSVSTALYNAIKDDIEYPEQNKKLLEFLDTLTIDIGSENQSINLVNSKNNLSHLLLIIILIKNYIILLKKKFQNVFS